MNDNIKELHEQATSIQNLFEDLFALRIKYKGVVQFPGGGTDGRIQYHIPTNDLLRLHDMIEALGTTLHNLVEHTQRTMNEDIIERLSIDR